MKDDKTWGYRIEKSKKIIQAIHFNSGVSCYVKSYQQPPSVLQAATLSGIFCDEEMPEHIYAELNFRGVSQKYFYYHNVFTATLGQEYLRRAMECVGEENETFPDAYKKQISMYDCLHYQNGKPSDVWDEAKIEAVIRSCQSEAEVQRRVFGKFVVSALLKFNAFKFADNTIAGHVVPNTWNIYAGLDWGSGGKKGHPSAIVYCAVSPDFKQGRIFKCWRGDGIPTTCGDVVSKYLELNEDMSITEAAYDYSASDIGTIASRNGISLTKANKSQSETVEIVNTLFKNRQLKIYLGNGYEENVKLTSEIQSATTHGSKINDDLIDAMRYCIALIPWQFEIQRQHEPVVQNPKEKMGKRERFWKYGYEGSELWSEDHDAEINEYINLSEDYGIY